MPVQELNPHTQRRDALPTLTPPSVAQLVTAARSGDERAWTELVRRFEPMMRRVARRYGLSSVQVDDVVQTSWMSAYVHIDDLRVPEAVGGWLRMTVRREAFRTLQGRVGELLTDQPLVDDVAEDEEPDLQVLSGEVRAVLSRAIARLPERHRRLMDVMLTEPGLPYPQISARTGIPIGSIGPIRGRCLVRMADHPDVQALRD